MMIATMDKRGITYQMVMWIPRIFYLITVLAVCFGFIFLFTTVEVHVGDIESHIIMHGMHFSPQGISKFDSETGRVYTGVVDEDKFTESNLENSVSGREDAFAMKVVKAALKDPTTNDAIILHKETYEDKAAIAEYVFRRQQSGKVPTGSGRWFAHKEIRYAYSENSDRPSTLLTVVIKPYE